MAEFIKQPGKDCGDVKIYALSTCGWCRKTKAFLNDNGVAYSYMDVDLLAGDDREDAITQVKLFNPRCSFPTVVINGGESVIVGFDEEKLKDLQNGK
jgi:Glutaredoxin and related proteins